MAALFIPMIAAPIGGDWPMNYMRTFGPRADPATALAWGLTGLSVAVTVIFAVLVAAGVIVRAPRRPASARAPQAGPPALAWFYVGLSLTVAALLVALVWTLQALAAVASPPRPTVLTLDVIGHEWWWEVRYLGATPDQTFETANEIHIPVGQPVLVRLHGADVIHSFWIPALTGKTDTIPGRTNIAWLQADRPGLYRGQCTEYCGVQHAHMAVFVVAEPTAQFAAWRQGQLQTAAPPPSGLATGEAGFVAHCGACHTVRGTDAGGIVGPDLTHLASRSTIAAGTLPNTPAALAGWIGNPQALKPGTLMPATNLTGPQLSAITAYLETLK